jgi:hypothetical protein
MIMLKREFSKPSQTKIKGRLLHSEEEAYRQPRSRLVGNSSHPKARLPVAVQSNSKMNSPVLPNYKLEKPIITSASTSGLTYEHRFKTVTINLELLFQSVNSRMV